MKDSIRRVASALFLSGVALIVGGTVATLDWLCLGDTCGLAASVAGADFAIAGSTQQLLAEAAQKSGTYLFIGALAFMVPFEAYAPLYLKKLGKRSRRK